MKKLIIILTLLLPTLAKGRGTATVIRIVDGDTLQVLYRGKKETIRLIGIDTPESKANSKAKRDAKRTGQTIEIIIAKGKQAALFTETLIPKGTVIKVEFDKQKRDRYGRLLAYVYLPSGEMLNEELIKAGYAVIMTIQPNVRHRKLFNHSQREKGSDKNDQIQETQGSAGSLSERKILSGRPQVYNSRRQNISR